MLGGSGLCSIGGGLSCSLDPCRIRGAVYYVHSNSMLTILSCQSLYALALLHVHVLPTLIAAACACATNTHRHS
jgi:hypothetical protein